MQNTLIPMRLEQAYMLSSNVKHFIFRPLEGERFDFIPGQFISIHFEHQGKTFKRSYSIANSPDKKNCIEIAASFVEDGPGTTFLYNLKPDNVIQITGPFGKLTLKEEKPERYILIATSTGVTPYRSMLPELQTRLSLEPNLSVVIMQGVQKREHILYLEEFLTYAKQSPRLTFLAFLSREASIENPEYERLGHVQNGFVELKPNKEKDRVYLCGNPAMIDDAFALLQEQEFTSQQIIREKYISSTSRASTT